MKGIEKSEKITVFGFEGKFILCSKWGKWVKNYNQGFFVTWYLIICSLHLQEV